MKLGCLVLCAFALLGTEASAQTWSFRGVTPSTAGQNSITLKQDRAGSFRLETQLVNTYGSGGCTDLPAEAKVEPPSLVITTIPGSLRNLCGTTRYVLALDGSGGERQDQTASGWIKNANVIGFRLASGAIPRSLLRPDSVSNEPAAPATRPEIAAKPTMQASSARQEDRSQPSEIAQMRAEIASLKTQLAASPGTRETQQIAVAAKVRVRALVIGNGNYSSFGRLPNPARDATAIAAKLRTMAIDTDLVLDADRDTLIRVLNEYSARAAATDVNVLFYAGHGVQVEGVNYIVPTNMRADGISAGYVKLAGISLNAVLDYLPARTRLVFLDACRDNPASRSLVATRGGAAVGLAAVSVASGTLIAYATRDGSTADDGVGDHSPYTAALLEHLGSPTDIAIVLRQVRQSVLRATGNRQEPWEYGSLVGDALVLSQIAR